MTLPEAGPARSGATTTAATTTAAGAAPPWVEDRPGGVDVRPPEATVTRTGPAAPTDSAPGATSAPGTGSRRQRSREWFVGGGWVGVVAYLVAQVGLLFWWAAFYPGLFSPDSLDYIWQSTTGNWSTHHSVPYTALVWLSLQTAGTVGALTLVQTIAMAAGVGYLAVGLHRLGAPAAALVPAAAVIVALPPVGSFVVCVWKDVGFVIACVFLVGTLARLVRRRGDGQLVRRRDNWLFALLAGEAALVALFRQNGFVVVAIIMIVAAILLAGVRLKIALAGAAAITVAVAGNLAVLPALGVRDGFSGVSIEAFVGDIAVAYQRDPESFSAADEATMATVAPLAVWRDEAQCLSSDTIVYHPTYRRDASIAHRGELIGLWLRILGRDPAGIIGTRWCRGAIAWSVANTPGLSRTPNPWSVRTYVERDHRIGTSPFVGTIVSAPLDGTIHNLALDGMRAANRPGLEWIFWRGATLAYLGYLVVGFAAWRRRDPRLLLLAAPILANQLSVLVFNNVQVARYMAAPYVLGVLLLPMAFRRRAPARLP